MQQPVQETDRADEHRLEAELDALVESIPSAVLIGDRTGIRRISRKALDLLGFDRREDLGRDIGGVLQQLALRDAATGRPLTRDNNLFARALRGESAEHEVIFRHPKTGQDRVLHSRAVPIRAGEEITGVVLVTTDVTGQRRADEMVHFLAEASLILAGSLDYQTTLTSVANLVVPKLADWCAIDVIGEDGKPEPVVVAHVDPEKVKLAHEVRELYPAPDDERSGAFRVMQSGKPELYSDITDEMLVQTARGEEHLRILRSIGMRSAVIVPLIARGRALGTISLIAAEAVRSYSQKDLPFLEELARSCALAVDNARLYQEAQHELADRRRAEQEIDRLNRDLKRRVDELQTLLDVAPVGLAVARDPEGKNITANRAFAEMLGITPNQNASKSSPEGDSLPFKVLRNGVEVPAEDLPMQFTARTGTSVRGDEYEIIRSDGRRFFLLEYASPLYDESGKIRGSLGAFVDVTGRKQAESELKVLNETLEHRVRERTAELEKANEQLKQEITERRRAERALERTNTMLVLRNRELQDFAYVASHDLQEPLRKIHSFADLVRTEYSDAVDEEGKLYLERIQSAATRMSGLIQDLLQFSRVATKGLPFQPVNLEHIIKDMLSDLEISIEESGGSITVENLPEIEADPMQMRQLFQNLIGNALKFRKPGEPPVIRIGGALEVIPGQTSGPSQRMCRLEIEDNGIGFDEKYLDRIFSPFQRLHGREDYAGTGMGLAICRRIVERHHGTLTARSKPGEGATFIIVLPEQQPEQDTDALGNLPTA
jgi:PAS domain S-box-containing protein